MEKEKTFYTKLIYEHRCPEDFGPERIEMSKTVWDLGLDELFEMFHGICISATFHEDSFKKILIEYLQEHYSDSVEVFEKEEDSTTEDNT